MSMAANRIAGVRAALCEDVEAAKLSRAHNDANVLVLSGRTRTDDEAKAILEAWLTEPFEGGRHERRVAAIDHPAYGPSDEMAPPGGGRPSYLFRSDPEIAETVLGERRRQETKLELIQPLGEGGVQKFLEKNGEGLHHIAFAVEDIEKSLSELQDAGFELIDKSPREGFGGHKVAFVHPKEFSGVLVELVED